MPVRRRWWLRSVLAVLVCLWLGLGPVLAASSVWESEPDCCCGSASACLLGGCDCGDQQSRESSPCGGLRSGEGTGTDASILTFGFHLGLVDPGISAGRIGSIDEIPIDEDRLPEPSVRSLEPPPPRDVVAR